MGRAASCARWGCRPRSAFFSPEQAPIADPLLAVDVKFWRGVMASVGTSPAIDG
jgi:hypothetical protein